MLLRVGGAVITIDRQKFLLLIVMLLAIVTCLFMFVDKLSRVSTEFNNLPKPTPIEVILRRKFKQNKRIEEESVKDKQPQNDVNIDNNLAPSSDEEKLIKKLSVAMAMGSTHRLKKSALREALKDLVRLDYRAADSRYNINVTLSDVISMDRPLPDTRPQICQTLTYDIERLPTVSVIIPFFNEAPTILVRTIHSILNRSPDKLLQEIILG